MPNLRSSSVSATGLTLVASNGKTVTLTPAQVLAQYTLATGSAAQRIATTIAWAKSQIEAALGAEMCPAALHALLPADLDSTTGRIRNFGVASF